MGQGRRDREGRPGRRRVQEHRARTPGRRQRRQVRARPDLLHDPDRRTLVGAEFDRVDEPVPQLPITDDDHQAYTGSLPLDPALADPTSQKDQQPAYARNPARSIRPELLVAVGICTHLGCSPSAIPAGTAHPSVGPDWQGGFFCPCHGSTFDLAGRVFKNKPAPVNLEVPPHHYVSDTRLRIGEDAA